QGVSPSVPADHDDDARRALRGDPARARDGDGLGAPPSARHHDRRRALDLADPDALHDAGHLSLHGQARGDDPRQDEHRAGGRPRGRAVNFSAPFIKRPIATWLLAIAILLAGMLAYTRLPVAPLPRVDFPTISVNANLPGASPETMASAVATPLERRFGRIAGVTEITSVSGLGSTSITLQFDLGRGVDSAARDGQAAINPAGG